MKLHHHILHFILAHLVVCCLCSLLFPSSSSPPSSSVCCTWADSWLLQQLTQWQPLLHCCRDKWVQIMPRHWQLISAKRRRLPASAHLPSIPGMLDIPSIPELPPAISEITNPKPKIRFPLPLSCRFCLIWHICLICILLQSKRVHCKKGERERVGAIHNNPQHGHNRYLVIVVGLLCPAPTNIHKQTRQVRHSRNWAESKAHTDSQTYSHTHTDSHTHA